MGLLSRNFAAAILAVSVFAPISGQAVTIIDNTGTGTAGTIAPFGSPNTATYGQTLLNLGGPDTALNSFSMFLSTRDGGSGTLDLRGYVAEWDGFKATNLLFESSTQIMNSAGTLQEFSFNTGSLALTSGLDYVFFLSISNLPAQPSSSFLMPTDTSGTSLNGNFVFMNNGNLFASLFSTDWNNRNSDAFFKAEFSSQVAVVPLPAALPLFGSGLAVMGFFGWRKRRKRAA